jgi:hypothetical protein
MWLRIRQIVVVYREQKGDCKRITRAPSRKRCAKIPRNLYKYRRVYMGLHAVTPYIKAQ